MMNRRDFFPVLCSVAGGVSWAQKAADPWAPNQLLQPAVLAEMLRKGERPVIIAVGFPVLFRQRHIAHSQLAGPASKPEGLTQLKAAVAKLPKNTRIVIYCGCCPMAQCPNIRPAYSTLKELGYTNIHVLDLPVNFHTDWEEKGYPVESSMPPR
ncbi:MAG TPA: rhodanese-like domain-containing protein [Bryobacteraceae bacterium]|nr:rhodanese-like domain-containing protein [Bryobacteraceae bacterium]